MNNTCSKQDEGMDKVRVRSYGGYKVISFDGLRVLELDDENYNECDVPQCWSAGVHIKNSGITFTPAFMERWRCKGHTVRDLKNVLPAKEKAKRNSY